MPRSGAAPRDACGAEKIGSEGPRARRTLGAGGADVKERRTRPSVAQFGDSGPPICSSSPLPFRLRWRLGYGSPRLGYGAHTIRPPKGSALLKAISPLGGRQRGPRDRLLSELRQAQHRHCHQVRLMRDGAQARSPRWEVQGHDDDERCPVAGAARGGSATRARPGGSTSSRSTSRGRASGRRRWAGPSGISPGQEEHGPSADDARPDDASPGPGPSGRRWHQWADHHGCSPGRRRVRRATAQRWWLRRSPSR